MHRGWTLWLASLSVGALVACSGAPAPATHAEKDAGPGSDARPADASPYGALPDTGPETPAPVSGGGEGPSANGPAKPPGGGSGGGGGFKPDDGAD